MKRRSFLTTSALATASLATGCSTSEKNKTVNINKNMKVHMKLATSWPAHFPIMGTGVETFVEDVKIASGGSIQIDLYPKNTLIPALQVFDACSAGHIDIFHSGPYYWKGKNSAFALFSGAPFGFTSEEINTWMIYGGGYELWRKLYAKHNLHPFMGGNTNIQMGGWFRDKITSVDSLKGLKMRIPGLGGDVMSKLGVNPILLPAGEIYSSLERSTIDATEWVGPALDLKMGFYKVAKNYYSGWHEPGSILELTFNKSKWDALSSEHRSILEMASSKMNNNMSFEFSNENAKALKKLKELGIEVKNFPKDVIKAAKQALIEVVREQSADNEDFKNVWESASSHLASAKELSRIGLGNYLHTRDN
jgi:TRAP-type mannitol/chloroaromatic compound transport system substrate-binding protein